MSPKNKKKLEIIRSKLDKLDNRLLSLIKYRTNLVKEVLKLKEFKKEIIDKRRINFILKKIHGKSKKLKIDPKITSRIWKNMIWSYIDYEKRNFKKKIVIYYVVEVFFQQTIHVFEYRDCIFLLKV